MSARCADLPNLGFTPQSRLVLSDYLSSKLFVFAGFAFLTRPVDVRIRRSTSWEKRGRHRLDVEDRRG